MNERMMINENKKQNWKKDVEYNYIFFLKCNREIISSRSTMGSIFLILARDLVLSLVLTHEHELFIVYRHEFGC